MCVPMQPWPNAARVIFVAPGSVIIGRAGSQKAQCSSIATCGGAVRIASHIGRRIVQHASR